MKNTRTVRMLDKYVGSIICFLLTMLHKMGRQKEQEDVRTVLFIEMFEMGSAIMACPSINYVRKKLSSPRIFCLCSDKVRDSWSILGVIPEENILSMDDKNMPTFILSFIKQVLTLRKENVDLVIDFELFMRISSIASFLVKAKKRAGFFKYEYEGLYRGNIYDYKCSFNQNYHIAKNFLALTMTAIGKSNDYPNYKGCVKSDELVLPSYVSDQSIMVSMKQKIRGYYPKYGEENALILVVPDVGKILPVRNYPKDYFIKVIKRLLAALPNYLILLVGVEENLRICSYIHDDVNDSRCINFCGQTTSIHELVELMGISELLIGMDNGPIHFASLTPLKILTLFSTDSPFMYGPLGNAVVLYSFYQCSPCISAFNHKNSKCRDNKCLRVIQPDTVFEYSMDLLNDKLEYRTVNNEIPYLGETDSTLTFF